MDETWTISELAERAATALAADGVPRVNGRVRDLPNERLIRWYTSIGLVDPPLGRRGRTALYGARHLLQLLAVKRRQALGRSIAEIQVELAGAPDSLLRRIALSPPDTASTSEAASESTSAPTSPAPAPTTAPHHAEPASAPSEPNDRRNSRTESGSREPGEWDGPRGPGQPGELRGAREPGQRGLSDDSAEARSDLSHGRAHETAADGGGTPGECSSAVGEDADSVRSTVDIDIDIARPRDTFWTVRPSASFHREPTAGPVGPVGPDDAPALVQGVRLAPGVTVIVETRHLGEDDLAAIAESAAPLLDTLRHRGLLEPAGRGGPPHPNPPGRHQ